MAKIENIKFQNITNFNTVTATSDDTLYFVDFDIVKKDVVSWGVPDYDSATAITQNTNYTCPSDGVIVIQDTRKTESESAFSIGTSASSLVTYAFTESDGNFTDTNFAVVPVAKDNIVKLTEGTITFYPYKGVE